MHVAAGVPVGVCITSFGGTVTLTINADARVIKDPTALLRMMWEEHAALARAAPGAPSAKLGPASAAA